MLDPFTEEHELFRKTVRSFVERELTPFALEWDRAGIFPRDVFRKCGELGLLGINLDPKYGGSGLDYWYVTVMCEELVRGVTPASTWASWSRRRWRLR